jgi:hypothetical protein
MTRMTGRFLEHVHHDPPKAHVLPIARLLGAKGIQRARLADDTSRLFDLSSVERNHRRDGVIAADSKLSRVVAVQVDRFHVLTRKRRAKPAPFDSTEMFENPKGRHSGRCHYPLGVLEGEAVDFSLDHGPVPVQKTSKGFTLISPHAQVVLHGWSLDSEGPHSSLAPP